MGLTSLDELALAVRDRVAKLYIDEAISAYNNQIYRAALVSAWTAVVVDIMSKLRELADGRDAGAQSDLKRIDAAIAAKDLAKLEKLEK